MKHFWCGILIVVLSVGLVTPARAANGETVLIVVAATALAATIAIVAIVASVHHRRNKILITGCVMSAATNMTLTDEADKKTYSLSGNITSGIKPGDRMMLQGKKANLKGAAKTPIWQVTDIIKDFGVCPAQPISAAQSL